jgi:NADPH-dependent glutamate synthase beta subunit-like oxidoreductase/coenzyme F420-reducing hydrogenase delta subunit/NAD-dependent dihydropyrimidine dehydrogenase PreA subunit
MPRQTLEPSAVVVGHGPMEARVALELAEAGIAVTLVSERDGLTLGDEGHLATPDVLGAVHHPRVQLLPGAAVKVIEPRVSRNAAEAMPGLRVTLHQSPRYVDPARCTACGACAAVCPMPIPGWDGIASDRMQAAIQRVAVPTSYAIAKSGSAPCRHACPIDQRAQGYVALVRAGNFEGAYRAIKRENPFPSVCGRVCNHRCEDACTRSDIDEPVAVMAIKRFVSDWAAETGIQTEYPIVPRSGFRVGVVGAGPAGLTAARDLNQLGHDVVVFEALPVSGGMMRVGIPDFRLPPERLQREIDEIVDSGVELRTDCRIEDVELLFSEGFDAVVLAVGLHASRSLVLPGAEDEEGVRNATPSVLGAIEFLRQVNLGARLDWRERKVLVVGGGSTAMDAARMARRLGADVKVIYRRTRAEMPAHDYEVRDAEIEGVKIQYLADPERLFRSDGRLVGVACTRMLLGDEDDSGRRRPVPVPGSHFVLPADTVLLAIGQTSDLPNLGGNAVTDEKTGVVLHTPDSLMTSRPGLFVAGDIAGTPGFVVDAIASGAKAARSVDRFLRGEAGVIEPVRLAQTKLDEAGVALRLETAAPRGTTRSDRCSAIPENLWLDFNETEVGLTASQAMAEAARCLSCGLCSECLACADVCTAGAIDHEQSDRFINLDASACIIGEELDADLDEICARACTGLFDGRGSGHLRDRVPQVLRLLGVQPAAAPAGVAAPTQRSLVCSEDGRDLKIGVFLCRCGGEIERSVNLADVGDRVERLPGVLLAGTVDYACHGDGVEIIKAAMTENALDGAVLAACSCCALDQICASCTTQRTRCKERLGVWSETTDIAVGYVNVREQCAFVHTSDPMGATTKAGDMIAACVGVLASQDRAARSSLGSRPEPGLRVPVTAFVDPARCRGCEDCEMACGLDAIHVLGDNEAKLASVDSSRCLGCGVCMAVCSSGAILAGDLGDAQIDAALEAMDVTDKTVVFMCNWGAYSAMEAAGVERLNYPPSVRVVRVMCAGRVHDGLLLKAFSRGARRALVLACRDNGTRSGCHYGTGADQSLTVVERTRGLLRLLGIDPARLGWADLHPGDGQGFVSAIRAFSSVSTSPIALGRP